MEEQGDNGAEINAVEPRLRATAYHEAGHAVMALVLGRPIQKVTVAPNQNYLGACQIQKGRFKPTKDWLEDEILILFAGMVAESQVTGRYCPSGAAQDLRGIRRYVLMRTGGERQAERLERRLLDKAEHLLADAATWKAVESIAVELLKSETISGRAARHFYDLAERFVE
jgi:plasmid stabilization system protein ParE